MPHNHCHEKRPDKLTKYSVYCSALAQLVGSGIWLMSFAQDCIGGTQNILRFSYGAFTIGMGITIYSMLGTAYSHQQLYKNHQPDDEKVEIDPESLAPVDTLSPINITQSQNYQSLDCQPQQTSDHIPKKLSFWQEAALVGDFIGHMMEVAAPLGLAGLYVSRENYSQGLRIFFYLLAIALSAPGAVAPYRTCKLEMLKS